MLAGGSVELHARQEGVVQAITATGAELHKHYRSGRWLQHCPVAPRAPLTKLPVLAATVYDVLPLDARLDRVGLINNATGDLWPVDG